MVSIEKNPILTIIIKHSLPSSSKQILSVMIPKFPLIHSSKLYTKQKQQKHSKSFSKTFMGENYPKITFKFSHTSTKTIGATISIFPFILVNNFLSYEYLRQVKFNIKRFRYVFFVCVILRTCTNIPTLIVSFHRKKQHNGTKLWENLIKRRKSFCLVRIMRDSHVCCEHVREMECFSVIFIRCVRIA